MATFDAQISAQVSKGQKEEIKAIKRDDLALSFVTEADVIREAVAIGMATLARKTPAARIELYARRRRGLS